MRRLTAIAAAALTATACATIDKGVDKGAEVLSEAVLPTSSEVQLGNQLAGQVKTEEPVLKNDQVQAYVNRVGQRLARASASDRKGITYDFTVIDKPDTVNAFALPGGHIFVYTGLLNMVGSEAELAAVLGHEVGHVTARHGAEALVKQMGLEAVAGLVLGKNPGQLEQLAAGIAAQGYMARHSRAAESEADTRGLQYLVKAGYDPRAMPTMFDKLAKLGGTNPNAIEAFFASHPDPADRARIASATISRQGLRGGKEEQEGGVATMKSELAGGGSTAPRNTSSIPPPRSSSTPAPAASAPAGSGGTSAPPPPPPPKKK
jgi:predicted Zn-dependent protease